MAESLAMNNAHNRDTDPSDYEEVIVEQKKHSLKQNMSTNALLVSSSNQPKYYVDPDLVETQPMGDAYRDEALRQTEPNDSKNEFLMTEHQVGESQVSTQMHTVNHSNAHVLKMSHIVNG